jgi:hypothetical protein
MTKKNIAAALNTEKNYKNVRIRPVVIRVISYKENPFHYVGSARDNAVARSGERLKWR